MSLAILNSEYIFDMLERVSHIFIIAISLFLMTGLYSYAQNGEEVSFTPYSIYGIGDIYQQGGAFNRGQGGVGVATRNKRFINYLNPAAVTARDSLSFMADYGLLNENRIMYQGDIRSANNTFGVSNLAISFPVYKSSAVMLGVSPYSTTKYGYYMPVSDQNIVALAGPTYISSTGEGGMYKLFASAGVTFFEKLSVGVEAIHYFGDIEKNSKIVFTDQSYNGISSGYNLHLKGNTAKLGLQYETSVGKYFLGVGATYTFATGMKGEVSDFSFSSNSSVDTVRFETDVLDNMSDKLRFGSEFSAGISLRSGEQWRAELDYSISGWDKSGFDNQRGFSVKGSTVFSSTVSESIRAGFEITPNANDIRYYFRRCTYRAGVYYNKAYYKLDGNDVNSFGITLGGTLPVFRLYNGLTFAVDLGQRGSLKYANSVLERYVNISIGVNIHDIWFQKYRYN